jgi:hypothetical protein
MCVLDATGGPHIGDEDVVAYLRGAIDYRK